ncbi:hypothetical protein ACFLS1_12680, partial [Verrucomicrobiota bacterium]
MKKVWIVLIVFCAVTAGADITLSEADSNLISITLDNVRLSDAVSMFCKISGANIIATPSDLEGTVTVNLIDVEWRPALNSILEMHNLELVERIPGSEVYSIRPVTLYLDLKHLIFRPPGTPESTNLITLDLTNASLGEVFLEIARRAKINIAYDPGLDDAKDITINLENVKSHDVLAHIFNLHELNTYKSFKLDSYIIHENTRYYTCESCESDDESGFWINPMWAILVSIAAFIILLNKIHTAVCYDMGRLSAAD